MTVIDCIFWAVTGGMIGFAVGMLLMLAHISRQLDGMYDVAFDSGVEYERETAGIAELLKAKEDEEM